MWDSINLLNLRMATKRKKLTFFKHTVFIEELKRI